VGTRNLFAPDSTTQQAAAQQAVQQAGAAASTMATSSSSAGLGSTSPSRKIYWRADLRELEGCGPEDFFRLIHEISGLNVVLDPAVKGTLTSYWMKCPGIKRSTFVMQNNSLDKQLNGNVLRIATRSTLQKGSRDAARFGKGASRSVAPVTLTRVLSYSKAATMATTLKKFLSSRGDVLFDERSNQLIIRDIPSVIPVLDNLIRSTARSREGRDAEIEARVDFLLRLSRFLHLPDQVSRTGITDGNVANDELVRPFVEQKHRRVS